METKTKQCPMCLEMVSAGVYKCRHCHHIFNSNFLHPKHPMFKSITPVIVFMSVLLILFIWLDNSSTSFSFKKGSQEITIVSSHRADTKSGDIIGEIKNNGSRAWYRVDISAKIFNKDGRWVDLQERSVYSLNAGETKSFKIYASECKEEETSRDTFEKYEVSIDNAILNKLK